MNRFERLTLRAFELLRSNSSEEEGDPMKTSLFAILFVGRESLYGQPQITSTAPHQAYTVDKALSGSFTLNVFGNGFTPFFFHGITYNPVVKFDGIDVPATFVDSNRLTALVPYGFLSFGSHEIRVCNQGIISLPLDVGCVQLSAGAGFSVTTLSLTSLSPNPIRVGELVLRVTGEWNPDPNFLPS